MPEPGFWEHDISCSSRKRSTRISARLKKPYRVFRWVVNMRFSGESLSLWERPTREARRVRVSRFDETCDPHPALRASLSQRERDILTGDGDHSCREGIQVFPHLQAPFGSSEGVADLWQAELPRVFLGG